ncbi:hypothetical protein [Okeania sp. SIO1I7]|uniref:hypothetical protein n=1 Tax=Okeania sp. SIO1I7 TaxID=2607772 RepID=UPI0013F860C4|nr:hypothetical protein [Okeania sp. SIO1I7]NET29819.1 hypothetical protein [Okeania sp. SIO1I7]
MGGWGPTPNPSQEGNLGRWGDGDPPLAPPRRGIWGDGEMGDGDICIFAQLNVLHINIGLWTKRKNS